jgi:hypothetical protein
MVHELPSAGEGGAREWAPGREGSDKAVAIGPGHLLMVIGVG